MFEKKDKVIKNPNEQLDAKQRLIERFQQHEISSKELSNKLETWENDLLKRQKLEEKSKMDEDVILKLENKNKEMEKDMNELLYIN